MSNRTLSGWGIAGAGVALLAASLGLAQAPKPPEEGEIKVREKVKVQADGDVKRVERVEADGVQVKEKVVHEHHFVPHRTSQMVGMHIQTFKGGDVGLVKDMILDCATGRVKYVVVEFSGFAGTEERLYALPWGVFECQAKTGSHEHVLLVDVTEQQLVKAPHFSVEAWPNFAETRWFETNDAYYHEHFKFRNSDIRRENREIRKDAGPRPAVEERIERREERREERNAPRDRDVPPEPRAE